MREARVPDRLNIVGSCLVICLDCTRRHQEHLSQRSVLADHSCSLPLPAYLEIVDVPSSAMSTSTESDVSLGPLGSTVMLAVM